MSAYCATIYNLTKYTNGGSVTLDSTKGSVRVSGAINVAAQSEWARRTAWLGTPEA